ncbi:Asparaginyl-tRNA synthetase, cytoplasmic (Asparagine--tRNA ligase) (AsnRS) [Tritrichomonas musculus]|uniref:Asparaginyl-tRNA synthetase, cytoplasmic (Asparagine--tRNA ligase) (AsnRS) n=1 Tax=Tritrichomonas musculus TaxID=1915356 RepID=A0ABR2JS70_9EUKA
MSKNKELPVVLVIHTVDEDEDWYKLCEDCKDKFKIEQASIEDIGISSYENYPVVSLFPPQKIKYEFQKNKLSIKPDLVLFRSCIQFISKRLGKKPDYRNILYGLIHSNIPMINSFDSLIFDLERPIMFGILKGIQQRIGKENFPLIEQYYYSDSQEMIISPSAPFVIKYSFPHAGYGKIRVRDGHDFEDIRSIVAIDNYYCAAEPLIDSEYEIRICFIAPDYYRVHKRVSCGWKVNYGYTNIREDIEMTPMYKMWVDEVRNALPGMDCFAIDAIIDKNGNHIILEVNGSSQGFTPEHNEECLQHLKKLVILRCEEIVSKKEKPLEKPKIGSDLEIENLNLKNEIESLKTQLKEKDRRIKDLEDQKKKKKK